MYIFCLSRNLEDQFSSSEYWTPPQSQIPQLQQLLVSSPKVQVVPTSAVDTLSSDPLSLDDDDKDDFKCSYLLVETAVAVRQREQEQTHL